MGHRIAVAGASGYAGGEVLRLLSTHPEIDIAAATAHSAVDTPIDAIHPHVRSMSGQSFSATTPEVLADADLVILALPHGQSGALAAQLPESVKIVDIGADHRLTDAEAWTSYYGGVHAGAWTYGLPELPGQADKIAESSRVAATGCYAVATILALAPIIAAGLGKPDDVVVVAASGTTGAGKSVKTHLLASEVAGSLTPYKVGAHQHVPEIKQATGAASVSFTPVLAPMPRGILSTVTVSPAAEGVSSADIYAALSAAYQDAPYVHVLPAGTWPSTKATLGSNSCHLQSTMDKDAGRIIVTSAIDNLGKGAAGQAIQCANLMLGLPETCGLPVDGVSP